MTKLVSIILVVLITIGMIWYVLDNVIGPGVVDGSNNLKQDIIDATS